jgi:hypothetical protein
MPQTVASAVPPAAAPAADRTRAFLVDKAGLSRFKWETGAAPALAPGEALLRHDRFALTANNVTYAKFGDAIDYWRYFPVAGPSQQGWGQIPVWGLGEVAASRCAELGEGERVYGYFPMARHLVVRPDRIKRTGFVDAAAHRAALPVTYNEYQRIDRDEGYDARRADQHLVLRPLFALSFFMAEYLKEEALFGARRLVISSASSKTAMALALLLARARPDGVRLVGLTSPGNAAFVGRAGHYDDVVGYDAIGDLDDGEPSLFVDIAGDANVRRAVHLRLKDQLRYCGRVGATHWDSSEAEEQLPGARPEWFFTPTHIVRRRAAWGAAVLRARLAQAWQAVLLDTDRWLRISTGTGEAAIEAAYREVLDGRVPPDLAHTLGFE